MNPGYISAFCMLIIVVVIWMGLLDGLLKRLKLGQRTLFILIFAMYMASGWTIPLGTYTAISIGSFVLPLLFFLFLWSRLAYESRNYSFAAALLLGVTLFLLRYMLQLDPILHVMNETYLIACTAAALPILMSRHAELILIIEGLGLCFMEILTELLLHPKNFFVVVGDFVFRDALVFSLCTALLVHTAVFRCVDASASFMRKVLVRRSRW
ncbi:YphA family membrane protein [Aneurinibacillus sp. REN35]|uniref:YphA family membrane protein n=1 Tax=Aneurinibacillus sp. REN35 TaxID=3237286 RepID=UPI003527B508